MGKVRSRRHRMTLGINIWPLFREYTRLGAKQCSSKSTHIGR
jgi:hypothetical protein